MCEKLAIDRGVKLSTRAVKPYPQKKGWRWKRLRYSPPSAKQPEYQQAKFCDLRMLELWARLKLICLKYLDESGFERSSPLGYSYVLSGQQKRVKQPRRRGRRLSILGLWQPQVSFDYGLVVGSFSSERYLKLMDWQASLAAQHLDKQGQITVVVQDNASSHKSQLVQQHWLRWQEQGLFVFFLPPYSPQMNRTPG